MQPAQQAPEALLAAVQRWKAAGGAGQPPSRWSPAQWQKWLPEHAGYIASLPQPISRDDVAVQCAAAPEGPGPATQAFIASMIWGFGPVGYGGYRTHRVLTVNEEASETLARVARIARDEGGPDAFSWLAQHRLRHLGVAFATKYLFFCAGDRRHHPALVLDRLVRDWLLEAACWRLSLEWNVGDYREYVERMSAWAGELAIEPRDLEMVVFQLAANADPRSPWRAPELFADTANDRGDAAGRRTRDDVEILGKLDEVAAMFAALPGATSPQDLADFERGVGELKRIASTCLRP